MAKNSLAAIKSKDNSKNSLADYSVKKSNAGRKPKPEDEKATNPITLKFTKKELEQIEEKAGLIPKATYLKSLLMQETSIFGED